MTSLAQRHVTIGDLTLGNDLPLVFIVGPNTLESRAHALEMSAALAEIAGKLGIGLIYKTSFDKANRSSIGSRARHRAEAGLPILAEVRETTGLPVLTDVHEHEQCAPVAEVVDVLQIPAFLCRQTDLLLAAGATGKPINIKKGQFLAPWDMKNVAAKIASTGNERILLCERGTSFGYNTLVVDMRALPIMAQTGYPVVFDATHAVAQPGGLGDRSGGRARICARPGARRRGGRRRRHLHRDASRSRPHAPRRGPDHGAAQSAAGAARNPDRLRPARQGAAAATSAM